MRISYCQYEERFLRFYQGFFLLEVLLALFLSAFLVMVLLRVTVDWQRGFALGSAIQDMTDRERFLTEHMTQAVHLAGFSGCSTPLSVSARALPAIRGYSSDTVPDFLRRQVAPNTDVLVLNGCQMRAYFVGDSGRKTVDGLTVYALYTKAPSHDREEWVEGVRAMRIRYGVVSPKTGEVVAYQLAADVSDWTWVRSVWMEVVLMSPDRVLRGRSYLSNQHLYRTLPIYATQWSM